MFIYRKATNDDLERIWNKDIEQNKDDERYLNWKRQYIENNKNDNCATFVVLNNEEPIGQVTVLFSPKCSAVKNKTSLCNGTNTANMNAFRIEKEFENQGHISKLVKLAEEYAKTKGIKFLTIGSEAKESRNLAIYLHFGYTEFVTSMIEDNDLILYYMKTLTKGSKKMKFNCLIPELRVFDLEKSKKFYTEILGFEIAYARNDFAMLVLGNCQIMLQQLTLPSTNGSWNVTDDMKYPLGRGINFQIKLPDISIVYNSLKHHNIEIFIDLLVSDYQENDIINHVLEFLVQDPDGYLLRFQQDIEDWHFGDNKKMADELFDLVLKGDKTATSYLYNKNDKLDTGFSILANWDKTKKIILQTTKIYKTTFDNVTEEHAFKEGEKDKTLKSWKLIHKEFFSKVLSSKGISFKDNIDIICEEFKIVKYLGEKQ